LLASETRGAPYDNKINEAYDRVVRSDVRYRFVIDVASLRGQPA